MTVKIKNIVGGNPCNIDGKPIDKLLNLKKFRLDKFLAQESLSFSSVNILKITYLEKDELYLFHSNGLLYKFNFEHHEFDCINSNMPSQNTLLDYGAQICINDNKDIYIVASSKHTDEFENYVFKYDKKSNKFIDIIKMKIPNVHIGNQSNITGCIIDDSIYTFLKKFDNSSMLIKYNLNTKNYTVILDNYDNSYNPISLLYFNNKFYFINFDDTGSIYELNMENGNTTLVFNNINNNTLLFAYNYNTPNQSNIYNGKIYTSSSIINQDMSITSIYPYRLGIAPILNNFDNGIVSVIEVNSLKLEGIKVYIEEI